MKNLEAADLLDNLIGMVSDNHDSDYDEALSKGRDILKSEPCEDCISRQAVIDACDQSINLFEAVDRIKELPPVTPLPKGHGRLVDADANIKELRKMKVVDEKDKQSVHFAIIELVNAPTIIEADKESEDKG